MQLTLIITVALLLFPFNGIGQILHDKDLKVWFQSNDYMSNVYMSNNMVTIQFSNYMVLLKAIKCWFLKLDRTALMGLFCFYKYAVTQWLPRIFDILQFISIIFTVGCPSGRSTKLSWFLFFWLLWL